MLFAAYKGDLPYYVEGAKVLDSLHENSKVLIAECCPHAPQTEDIGRGGLLTKERITDLATLKRILREGSAELIRNE